VSWGTQQQDEYCIGSATRLIIARLEITRSRLRDLPQTAFPVVILALPSLWILFNLPPLWRDVDAYVQTTYPPAPQTILLHGPLYCTLSRMPLWLGYLASGGRFVWAGHFFEHSQLTDAGVLALILAQHAALVWAAFYLITACATGVVARTSLAVFFACQPFFYAFAQCVGSETLSLILMLVVAGAALRLVRCYPRVRAADWVVLSALLCCCILTRKINLVLAAAMLPLTMTVLALRDWWRGQFRWRRQSRVWFASFGVAVAAIVWATAMTHLLCWRAGIPWRPKFGYTVIWRLNFLQPIPPLSRAELLRDVAARCNRPDSARLVKFLRDWFEKHPAWQPARFARDARRNFFSGAEEKRDADFDLALDDIAHAFLLPPSAPLRTAALRDFFFGLTRGQTDAATSLFQSTTYFFAHPDEMPQCASLSTFQIPEADLLRFSNLHYLHWWSFLSMRAWLIGAGLPAQMASRSRSASASWVR